MTKITQRIPFQLIEMPCCHMQICHVNHRLPMYCSGCGERVWPDVKGCILINDQNAILIYNDDERT